MTLTYRSTSATQRKKLERIRLELDEMREDALEAGWPDVADKILAAQEPLARANELLIGVKRIKRFP